MLPNRKRYVGVLSKNKTLHRPSCRLVNFARGDEGISSWASAEGRHARRACHRHCKVCKPDVPKLVEGGLGFKGLGSW